MDELTLLHRYREDDRPADGVIVERVAAARARVEQGMRPSVVAPRRRVRVALAVGVTAVLAITAAVVLAPRSVEPTAAAVLNRAADATVDAAPTALETGEFLRVEVRESALGYVTSNGDDYDGAYRAPDVTITWIPADHSSTWVREQYSGPATAFYGGAGVRRAAERDYATEAHQGDAGSITRVAGGEFTNGELGGTPAGTITIADIPTLPRDASELLRRIVTAPGDVGASRDQRVMDTIGQLLGSGLVPLDLQAAMYKALALLPDLTVTHDQADLDGRAGTAVGLANGNYLDEIIVDDRTGAYIGRRSVQTKATGDVPAGTVASSTSVRISVTRTTP
jgi:hypothetical protein